MKLKLFRHSRLRSLFKGILTLSMTLVTLSSWALDADLDLKLLQESGFIMGPGNATNPVSDSWKKLNTLMKQVDAFDAIADKIESVVCGDEQNKSVLIVGDPSVAFMYIFARAAGPRPNSKCPANMWHVELNTTKVEAGNKYVGDVEKYWQDNVLAPTENKKVVLYLSSLDALIGLGSHSNDETGIEKEYASNITSGKMRSVAFIDKYQYNQLIRSRNAYVLEAFADKIILPTVDSAQALMLAKKYLQVLYPTVKISENDLQFIVKNAAYYQPNRNEPDRTLSVINTLLRDTTARREGKAVMKEITVESPHPYNPSTQEIYQVIASEFDSIQLEFDQFDLEDGFDYLEIYNANDSGDAFTRLTGKMAAGTRSDFFPANKLKLLLKADNSGSNQGFKISKIYGKKLSSYEFTRDEVRHAVLSVAQVPQWIMDRDYSIIKNLEGNLNKDVVGVAEGKKDLVRLAKNGYVAGRTDEKPVATVMLAGPTGTGKSFVAKKLAEHMQLKLITLDMTSYKDPSSFSSFQEVMARYLTNNPYAVYLFEEIDKASIEVLDQLYFMMDEGVFYDPYQRPLFARGAYVIMTTNAASDVILKDPNNPNLRTIVMDEMKKSFRMSFLNRFDAISIFKPFTDPEFNQLAQIMVSTKVNKIKETFEWNLSVDAETLKFISIYGRSAEFGARPMERLVESTIGIGIAEYQINESPIPEKSDILINKLEGVNRFRITVAGKSVDYTVDTNSNNGMMLFNLINQSKKNKAIFEMFRKNRNYND